jgi:hypothetical protein
MKNFNVLPETERLIVILPSKYENKIPKVDRWLTKKPFELSFCDDKGNGLVLLSGQNPLKVPMKEFIKVPLPFYPYHKDCNILIVSAKLKDNRSVYTVARKKMMADTGYGIDGGEINMYYYPEKNTFKIKACGKQRTYTEQQLLEFKTK